jgi:signal transduction histidine kinase
MDLSRRGGERLASSDRRVTKSAALGSAIAAGPPVARPWSALVPLQGPVFVAIAYYLGAEAAFYIGTLSDQIFALFWPPNVVLFCALLIVPQRRWWLYIAAALPAHTIAELGVGMPFLQLFVAFATNCMVALLDAYAVRRFVGEPPWFGNFRKAFLYIVVAAGLGPAVSAFGGAFVPILGGGSLAEYWIYYSHWYLANALPNLTLGPVFLIWYSDRAGWRPSLPHVEPAVLAVALVGVCMLTVAIVEKLATNHLLPVVLLLPLPLILWSAIRFGEKGASAAILVVAVILTWYTLHGGGLFPGEGPERSVLTLQLFLTGASIPVLLLGASIDDSRRAEQTMRELAVSVVRAQEEERRRIARDLHDSTGQNLIAATLLAGRVEKAVPETARPAFRQLENMLQQSIRELRTVSYLLHPPLLDEAGLGLALRNFINGFIDRTGIAVDLEVSPELDRLAPETELVLFRVVQEALGNIARHSMSKTALIRLDRRSTPTAKTAVLTIEDAGKGMPGIAFKRPLGSRSGDRVPPTGVGLASMRERLHQIGGQLEIDSAVGHTTLTATIPIRAEPAD